MNDYKERSLSQEHVPTLLEERVKVKSNHNPFHSAKNSVWIDVSRIEDIPVYHRRLKEVRRLIDILKDQAIKKRVRKRIAKDVLKQWNRDFKAMYKSERAFHLDRASVLKSKKVRLIDVGKMTLFASLTLFFLLISNRWSFLSKIPLLGRLFTHIYHFLDTPHWNNLVVLLTYASLFTTLYYLVIRSYYNLVRNIGSQAEGYVRKSFRKIKRKYKGQYRLLKRHLLKLASSRYYKKTLRIKQIYSPQESLEKLNHYIEYLTERLKQFEKRDIILQIGGIGCHIVVFGGIAYLLFGLLFLNS